MVISQYRVYWVDLNPTIGSEINKIRPCLVISPDEMNRHINTVIIAPLTSKSRNYPTRVKTRFSGRDGWIVLDQIRCIDKRRLKKDGGSIDPEHINSVKNAIKTMLVD